ncbi:MAG: DUF2953 domain-containing protein [Ruminiclostridium sp.]|nr:DUF2953 domain-containing protein [Ruminiclostridium sp.]
MTGWIIFGSIVLLILIILWQSVKVIFVYENELELKVKFLFFTIYPTKPKKKKKPKKQKKQKQKKKAEKTAETKSKTVTAEKSDTKPGEQVSDAPVSDNKIADNKPKKKEKTKLNINLDMIMDFVRSASPPLKRLFKKIRWYDVYVDWVVGSDDAAKTALMYGGICSVLYPFFKWLDTYFTAHIKEINIEADFSKEKSDIFAYFVLKLRLSTALACVIWLAVRVLKTYLKYSDELNPSSAKKGK